VNQGTKVLAISGVAALLFSTAACAPLSRSVRDNTDSFADCMLKGGAASGILAIVAGKVRDNKKAGVVVGVAGMIATWVTCAQAWKEIKSTAVGDRDQAISKARGRPIGPLDLAIDGFTVTASRPGEYLLPDANYTVLSNDAQLKDIKLTATWKFWIPAKTPDGRITYPTDQVVEFPNEVTVQQGKRNDGGKLPTPDNIPGSPPWYAMFSVKGDGGCVASMTRMPFSEDGKKDRPVTSTGTPVTCESTPEKIEPLPSWTAPNVAPSSDPVRKGGAKGSKRKSSSKNR